MRARAVVAALACSALWVFAPLPGARADTTVHAELVQQNRSGASGTVTLTAQDDGALRVRIRAEGLMPGPHAQHIHGAAGGGSFKCASASSDADGDGWLTNEEASGEYGNVFLALTTKGATGTKSGLDLERMPVADSRGRLTYQRIIPARMLPPGLVRNLQHVHVVQHGIDVDGNGKYNISALGVSTFAQGLGLSGVPEEATDPASCGMLMGAAAAHAPHGGVATGTMTTVAGDSRPVILLGVGLLALAAVVERRRRKSRSSAPA